MPNPTVIRHQSDIVLFVVVGSCQLAEFVEVNPSAKEESETFLIETSIGLASHP